MTKIMETIKRIFLDFGSIILKNKYTKESFQSLLGINYEKETFLKSPVKIESEIKFRYFPIE